MDAALLNLYRVQICFYDGVSLHLYYLSEQNHTLCVSLNKVQIQVLWLIQSQIPLPTEAVQYRGPPVAAASWTITFGQI